MGTAEEKYEELCGRLAVNYFFSADGIIGRMISILDI